MSAIMNRVGLPMLSKKFKPKTRILIIDAENIQMKHYSNVKSVFLNTYKVNLAKKEVLAVFKVDRESYQEDYNKVAKEFHQDVKHVTCECLADDKIVDLVKQYASKDYITRVDILSNDMELGKRCLNQVNSINPNINFKQYVTIKSEIDLDYQRCLPIY